MSATAVSSARRFKLPGIAPLLVLISVAAMALLVLLPLVVVFQEAFRGGVARYWADITEPDALAAIRLTLLVAAISVPLNAVFGIAAAWTVAKFEFKGKSLLLTIIDLPFSISPVVSGLVWVLLFGAQGWFGEWLIDPAVRGPRADPVDAGPGVGRGGRRADSGGQWRHDLLEDHHPQHQMGAALWGAAVQRPGDGGIRRGVGGVRTHPRPDNDPASAR